MVKDILIVGCGPTGLYAWKMAADLKLSGTVVEAKSTYGGQITSSYPEKYIHNFPAIDKILGNQAVQKMYECIKKDNNINFFLNTIVTSINIIKPDCDEFENWFEVCFSNNTKQKFKRILFTDGFGIYKPIELTEKKYNNIIYTVKDIKSFKNQSILIFGGGDSALDWANELSSNKNLITIIHRRDEFRAKPLSLEQAKSKGVNFLTPYKFSEITGEKLNNAEKLKVIQVETNEEKEICFDKVIVQFGYTIEKEKFENLNLEINKLKKIIVKSNMESSVEGIYAAGDCCHYDTKVRNLLAGFYEAMIAVVNIEKKVNKRKILNSGW
ncbi:NAD(P)/FAD-dependent oxidoreductase [Spiroplasma taiwanense]|uniref:Ferredoxin--NADP reductase n=1 Tax=Spiroplasma taiwanense CT-1 TaxID=1276220 RepID=S5LW89_9MOLU|nr:NAD(P)/FAD-dependent oxidoreductase [Spiroplasma taiwanense]AGR40871.1 thioredoxin reductase [Spiroplasma taiwanense CT-1]